MWMLLLSFADVSMLIRVRKAARVLAAPPRRVHVRRVFVGIVAAAVAAAWRLCLAHGTASFPAARRCGRRLWRCGSPSAWALGSGSAIPPSPIPIPILLFIHIPRSGGGAASLFKSFVRGGGQGGSASSEPQCRYLLIGAVVVLMTEEGLITCARLLKASPPHRVRFRRC